MYSWALVPTNLASVFSSFCVTCTDERWRNGLEVRLVTVFIAPHWQLGLALHCTLLAPCSRDGLHYHRDRDHCVINVTGIQQNLDWILENEVLFYIWRKLMLLKILLMMITSNNSHWYEEIVLTFNSWNLNTEASHHNTLCPSQRL
jgi:hypothetical protein